MRTFCGIMRQVIRSAAISCRMWNVIINVGDKGHFGRNCTVECAYSGCIDNTRCQTDGVMTLI